MTFFSCFVVALFFLLLKLMIKKWTIQCTWFSTQSLPLIHFTYTDVCQSIFMLYIFVSNSKQRKKTTMTVMNKSMRRLNMLLLSFHQVVIINAWRALFPIWDYEYCLALFFLIHSSFIWLVRSWTGTYMRIWKRITLYSNHSKASCLHVFLSLSPFHKRELFNIH